jgi:hypothetical protein
MPTDREEIVFSHPHDHFRFLHLGVVPNTCFVLMPFEARFQIVYETISAALGGLMTCARADDLKIGSPILERILSGLQSSELIIADLTGRNANVFYEVGLAHTRTKNVLLLTQKIKDVPFDLQGLFCHTYSVNSADGIKALKKVVRQAAIGVRARSVPAMLEGALDRSEEIVRYIDRYLSLTGKGRELVIRIQSGYSSFSNEGFPDAHDEETRRYGDLLEQERDGLIRLLESGARLQAILYTPPMRVEDPRRRSRVDRLITFLRRRDAVSARCEFVYSSHQRINLLFLGEEVLFEGHKTGVEGGYGWTMVYTDKAYLFHRLRIFDMLFHSAGRYTLRRFGRPGADESDRTALRDAVITAIEQARDGTLSA